MKKGVNVAILKYKISIISITDFMNNIIINSRDQLLRLEISKIVYFEADGNYTKVVMSNKLKSVLPLSLSNMEKALSTQLGENAATFVRVGKRFIINRRYIYDVNISKQHLVLTDFSLFAFQLPISKAALRSIKAYLSHSME